MHINHRRKSVYRARHHNGYSWPRSQRSFAWYKRLKAHRLRASVRELLHHERWDDIAKVPKTILWEFN